MKTNMDKLTNKILNGIEWLSDTDNIFFLVVEVFFSYIIVSNILNLYSIWMATAPFSWAAVVLGTLMFLAFMFFFLFAVPFYVLMASCGLAALFGYLHKLLTSKVKE